MWHWGKTRAPCSCLLQQGSSEPSQAFQTWPSMIRRPDRSLRKCFVSAAISHQGVSFTAFRWLGQPYMMPSANLAMSMEQQMMSGKLQKIYEAIVDGAKEGKAGNALYGYVVKKCPKATSKKIV